MIRLFRISVPVILTMALAIASVAGPWTGGRGQGNRNAFPDVEFPQAPAVVWKAFLGGNFASLSPSNTLVAAGNVIVAYDKYLLALSMDTGEPRWRQELYAAPLGDLLLLDNKIIVTTPHGVVLAFNPADGEQLWRIKLTDSLRNGPVLGDSVLLYTTKSNTIESVNLNTVATTKRSTILARVPEKIEAAPIYVGKSFLLCYTDGTIMRLEENGVSRWSIKLPNTVLGQTPVTDGRMVVVSTPGAIHGINPVDRDRPVRWVYPCVDRLVDPPTVSEGRVFMATRGGELRAIDLETGKDLWTRTEPAKEKSGAETADAAAPKPGILLPATPVASPIALKQHLLMRLENGMIALYEKDSGKLAWLYRMMPPAGLEAPSRYYAGAPAVVGNEIFFAGADTQIYRLSKTVPDLDPPTFSWVMPANSDRGYIAPNGLRFLGGVIADEGAGMHAGLVSMKLNNYDLTPEMKYDAPTGYYYFALNPQTPLRNGLHRLSLTAKDFRGNEGTFEQSFIVAGNNADYVEVQIGGEFVPKTLQVKPGTVICWRNNAGGPRTVVSELKDEPFNFSSDAMFPNGIPNKERWVWIVPEDVEPGTIIFYYCRLQGKPGDGTQMGIGLAGALEIVEQTPLGNPAFGPGGAMIGPAGGVIYEGAGPMGPGGGMIGPAGGMIDGGDGPLGPGGGAIGPPRGN